MTLPLENTTRLPTSSKTRKTGTSQYFFLANTKRTNSRRNFICSPRIRCSVRVEGAAVVEDEIVPLLMEHAIPDHRHLDFGAHRAVKGILGRIAIGSPPTLKLVFTSTGHPVFSLNARR